MKPIYECLDYLLNHLHENRFKAEGQRLPFDIDNVVLPFLGLNNHEEFRCLMDMLIDDNYAFFIADSPLKEWPLKYTQRTMITPRGIDFKMKGGYKQRAIYEAAENTRVVALEKSQMENANRMTYLTVILAVSAFATMVYYAVDLYWSHKWFQSSFWWAVSVVVIVLSGLTAYLIKRLLPPKK